MARRALRRDRRNPRNDVGLDGVTHRIQLTLCGDAQNFG
jgi:hypothetical protein